MISANLTALRNRIDEVTKKAGRNPADVTLIAVSKTFPVESILEAYDAGARDFGENRVQDANDKIHKITKDIRWHFIGRLQTNKVKLAVKLFDVIHSVDSLKLATKIDSQVKKLGREKLDIMLEVNLGRERQKSGVFEEDVLDISREMIKLRNVSLTGLMTIPPYTVDKNETRKYYKRLRELRDETNEKLGGETLPELSMGMSGDFDIALEEGATYIRVGTAIFGDRTYY